jgi:hypothetical protein
VPTTNSFRWDATSKLHATHRIQAGSAKTFPNRGTISLIPELRNDNKDDVMAKAKKQTARDRKQDRARVAAGQDHEARYEAKKSRRSSAAVKKTFKKVGNGRKRVERALGRKKKSWPPPAVLSSFWRLE